MEMYEQLGSVGADILADTLETDCAFGAIFTII